jgi:hypothetical protein
MARFLYAQTKGDLPLGGGTEKDTFVATAIGFCATYN